MEQPKKWTEVYPHGTKEGDDESKFFRALARHPKYDWRSTGAIVKASKLSAERVEEIIDKYINTSPPLIFPHPKNDAHWGYWERVPDMLKDDDRDLSTKDKDNRIGKHLGADVTLLADEEDVFLVDLDDDDIMADKTRPWYWPQGTPDLDPTMPTIALEDVKIPEGMTVQELEDMKAQLVKDNPHLVNEQGEPVDPEEWVLDL